MDYSFYLKTHEPDFAKLKEYGFQQDNGKYSLRKNLLENGLYTLIHITAENITVRVIDSAFDEDYIPFGIKGSKCSARFEVEELLENIVSECFFDLDIVSAVTEYIEKTYGIKHEEPWSYLPGYYTFKTPNSQKWYAIIMRIPRNKIGLDGENLIDIINVKVEKSKIERLIDNRHYFPSYHMSRKNWITILLDKDTNIEYLKTLIANSFQMVEKPKKSSDNWIVPANPKYYDVDKAIAESPDKFIWKQGSSVKKGDIVYLYIAAPVSAVKYKCKVTKTDIPYKYSDGNLKMSYAMELKLMQKYDDDFMTFSKMKDFGINAVRGPRRAPDTLIEEMNKYVK